MDSALRVPDAPPPELRYKRRVRIIPAVRELWRVREMVRTLTERDIRARYKQAMLGLGWSVLTPFVLMVAFTLFLRRVVDVETHGVPYPVFSYIGLLPWTFFSSAVASAGSSIVSSSSLLNKIYCPREVFPLAQILGSAVDTTIASGILVILFFITRFVPHIEGVWAPMYLIVQLMFTTGVALFTSSLLVYFRDLRHALPLLLQIGLFATPVAWGIDAVPVSFQPLYSALNPMAPVIDGYRRTLLQGQPPNFPLIAIGAVSAFLVLVTGYLIFKRLEKGFADLA